MPFEIVHGDITRMKTDGIVNAANTGLHMGGGVCGAIFMAAGPALLQKACAEIGGCPTGSAVITRGFGLPAKYIIHAVGPVWQGGGKGEREMLYSCYTSALNLAQSKGLCSIAFPLISAGIYGYPRKQAQEVAAQAIGDFLKGSSMQVYLVLFGG